MSVHLGPYTQGITRSGPWIAAVKYRDYLKPENRIKVLGFASEMDAVEWETRFHLRTPKGHLTMTMDEFFEQEHIDYYRNLTRSGAAKADTIQRQLGIDREKYDAYIRPVLGQTRVSDITPERLTDFYDRFRRSSAPVAAQEGVYTGPTNSTKLVFAFLYDILEHITRLEIEQRADTLQLPVLTKEKLLLWRDRGIPRLFELLEGDIVLSSFFSLMLHGGLHEHEVAALSEDDIDFRNSAVIVTKAGRDQASGIRKICDIGTKKTRVVSIPPDDIRVLDELFHGPGEKPERPFWFVTRHFLLKSMQFVAGTNYLPVLSLPEFHKLCSNTKAEA